MYFMNQNKKKEATKQKERDEKAKLKDVNMAAPSFDRKILNDQHKRDKDAKAKERAQPGENAKFDMAVRRTIPRRLAESSHLEICFNIDLSGLVMTICVGSSVASQQYLCRPNTMVGCHLTIIFQLFPLHFFQNALFSR